jgi:predicted PurR-regulated permease PerM
MWPPVDSISIDQGRTQRGKPRVQAPAEVRCGRDGVISIADRYVKALVSRDPAQLPLTPGLTFTEGHRLPDRRRGSGRHQPAKARSLRERWTGGPVLKSAAPPKASSSASSPGNPREIGPKPVAAAAEAQPSADQDPVDVRHVALTLVGIAALIWLLKNMQEVLIPFVVSGLLFYALDPFVDRLQRWRVPRVLGATLMLLVVVAAVGGTVYQLTDDLIAVVEQVPQGVEKLRNELRQRTGEPSSITKVQEAAEAIDRSTAEAATPVPTPPGVTRVQVETPTVRASDYVWSAWLTVPTLVGVGVMIFFLTLFLLVADDLFKRKLVANVGETFSEKRVTVEVLDAIGTQMERFILVQIFTSIVVAVVTTIVLWWLGMRQPAVWGLVAGLFNSIPYFGPVIVTMCLTAAGYIQFEAIGPTATVAAAALAITTLEGWVLTPLLLGRVAEMNRIAIFAGLLFWSWMWGVWGMLLAVPIMMAIKVVCDHVEPFKHVGDFLSE